MAEPGSFAQRLAAHPLAGRTAPPAPPAIPAEGVVRIAFESDWHVGTGAGIPGLIDKLILRDADGLPQVPAKSLSGVWRDAAERLAWALDERQPGRWHRWVEALFGTDPTRSTIAGEPRPAALSLTAARIDLPALRKDGVDRALKEALTFVKPGVRISAETGRAEPGHLRFIEMATGGLVLHATCRLESPGWDDAQRKLAWAFLVGALGLVEAVGAGRRRGQGRCTASLVGHDRAMAARALEDDGIDPPPFMEATFDAPRSAPVAQGERRQRLTLTLRSPLVVAQGVQGNVVLTRHHVPGAMLLATLFPRLAGAMGAARARKAVAEARLRVLDARPWVVGARGEPAPLCLHQWKEDGSLEKGATVVNLSCQAEPKDEEGRTRQTKPVRGTWLAPSAALAPGLLPDFLPGRAISTALITHNTIDDERQRPIGLEDGGAGPGVYSYEAITSAGPFLGELRLGDGLPGLPPGTIQVRLGRSRKDDYGLATLEIGPEEAVPGRAPSPPAVGGRLWIRLLSDLLPVGEALGSDATVEAVRQELERRLGIGLRLPESGEGAVSAAVRLTRIETWHARWSLARPTLTALAAGSVIGFEVTAIPSGLDLGRKLASLERTGLGDRRAEGFGEIRVQDPLVVHPVVSKAKGKPCTLKTQDAGAILDGGLRDSNAERDLALRVQRAAWEDGIALQALVSAGDAAIREAAFGLTLKGGPSASQLGRLREQVGRVRDRDGALALSRWLKDEADADAEANANRGGVWGSIAGAIRRLLDDDGHRLWPLLSTNGNPLPVLAEHEADAAILKKDLWAFAFRHFLFASLRAHGLAMRMAAADAKTGG